MIATAGASRTNGAKKGGRTRRRFLNIATIKLHSWCFMSFLIIWKMFFVFQSRSTFLIVFFFHSLFLWEQILFSDNNFLWLIRFVDAVQLAVWWCILMSTLTTRPQPRLPFLPSLGTWRVLCALKSISNSRRASEECHLVAPNLHVAVVSCNHINILLCSNKMCGMLKI